MVRKKFIAGNWKMNTALDEAVALAKGVADSVGKQADVDVAVCPPSISLSAVAEAVKGSNVKVGAQDVHWEGKGAFTGKVSCDMLKSAGASYVIIGHSEQRQYFGETDETVNKKTKAALTAGLLPIVCVGETLEEREDAITEAVIEIQTRKAFKGIDAVGAAKCTIAYEPVWAIGTGKTATPQQANEVHIFIRGIIAKLYDKGVADGIRIQYGGSMKPDNAKELLAQSDIDGGLIGGAALKAVDFAGIVQPK